MLFGRDEEEGLLAKLIRDARAGRSGAIALLGDAGVGKSVLMDYAAEIAGGLTILRARGLETERDLAFSGLHDLLRPVLHRRHELPAPQVAALEAALALGPPLTGDRFTVSAATLGLLGVASEDRPVLILIDDLQWLDRASVEAVLFAGRRLGDEGVAMVIAARAEELEAGLLSGIHQQRLRPLDRDAARALLDAAGLGLAPDVADAVVEATEGNPLALLEGSRLLTGAQRLGREPLSGPLPVGPTIAERFRVVSSSLGPDAMTALLVAATAGEGLPAPVLRTALGLAGVGLDDLEDAERLQLVEITPQGARFPHPLLRAACYHAAAPGLRRAAHRAIASALGESGRQEARAWHMAAAALEPDEEVAEALEDVARAARGRSGHSAAASAFSRAAELTPRAEARAARLVEAAHDAHLGGEPDRALALLADVLASEPRAGLRAAAEHLRGQINAWKAPLEELHERLVREAERVAAYDPGLSARMLGDAAISHLRSGSVAIGLQTAERAVQVAQAAGITHSPAEWVLGMGLVIAGRAREATEIVEHWTELAERTERPLEALGLFQTLPRALMWLEDYERARLLAGRLVERARGTAPAVVPIAVATLAEIDLRTGDLPAARAGASEGVALARVTDQPYALGFCLAGLARVDAVTGHADDCRAHATEAREVGTRLAQGTPVATFGEPALGLLALASGEVEDAARHLEAVARACEEWGLVEPAMVQFGPSLVEALVRCGRRDEARDELERFAARAEQTGRRWAMATAARCRGLLAPESGFEACFEEAMSLHDLTPTPLERARTELCFGERLRRARRRGEARARLRSALATFESLGALPWAARASDELRLTGERAPTRGGPRTDALTTQELQVALMIATGVTNREAGARLFLSAKTVEAHLGRIYRKLKIRSRTELAALVSSGGLASAQAEESARLA